MNICKPRFENVSLEDGLNWGSGNWRFEEKLDGVYHVGEILTGTVGVGELMRDGTVFWFDLLELDGTDLRDEPLSTRIVELNDLTRRCFLRRPIVGVFGGNLLRTVLAKGGEGIVAKPLDGPWGSIWYKCKRQETFDCLVTAKRGTARSVRISLDGEDAGWLPVFNHYDSIDIGDCVEVLAYGRTAKGKLREPRFVKLRLDKGH